MQPRTSSLSLSLELGGYQYDLALQYLPAQLSERLYACNSPDEYFCRQLASHSRFLGCLKPPILDLRILSHESLRSSTFLVF